ncbi:MAG: hypothetical protein ACLU2Y_04470 [Blautia massiliensis (ex Durand et al. 2017)]|uniref:hypothetical protein n=1 Tax=Blautia massiliensis (ex Durand et al. 2017) TaxID=1737424 RepID=UPI00399D004B
MTMTRNSGQVKESRNQTNAEKGSLYYLDHVLEKGRFEVGIAIYQLNTEGTTKLSMANNGFEHLACIRNNTRGSWLELTTREMHAHSRIDGADMRGRLSSLKYKTRASSTKPPSGGQSSHSPKCLPLHEDPPGKRKGNGLHHRYLQRRPKPTCRRAPHF